MYLSGKWPWFMRRIHTRSLLLVCSNTAGKRQNRGLRPNRPSARPTSVPDPPTRLRGDDLDPKEYGSMEHTCTCILRRAAVWSVVGPSRTLIVVPLVIPMWREDGRREPRFLPAEEGSTNKPVLSLQPRRMLSRNPPVYCMP